MTVKKYAKIRIDRVSQILRNCVNNRLLCHFEKECKNLMREVKARSQFDSTFFIGKGGGAYVAVSKHILFSKYI